MLACLWSFSAVLAEPQISLDLQTVPLSSVVFELERQTGQKHLLTGSNSGQMLFVKVDSLPASRVRDSVAWAARGVWKEVDGVQVLTTEPWTKSFDDAYARIIKRSKEYASATLSSQPDWPKFIARHADPSAGEAEARAAGTEWAEGTPLGRLLKELYALLPEKDLASIKEGERRVFSLAPTSLQFGFPQGAWQAFSRFQAVNRQFSLIASRYPKLNQDRRTYAFNAGFVDPDVYGEPRHLLLIVKRTEGRPDVQLKLYNQDGEECASQSPSLDMPSNPDEQRHNPLTKLLGAAAPQKLSPNEAEFNQKLLTDVLGHGRLPGARFQPDKLIADRLDALAKHDLLTFGPTELLAQLGKVSEKNIVAKVSDTNLFSLLFFPRRIGNGLAVLLERTYSRGGGNEDDAIQVEPDLIKLRPDSFGYGSQSGYFNRSITAASLGQAKLGKLRIDQLSQMCAAHQTSDDSFLSQLFLGIFSSQRGKVLEEDEFELLKFYSSLPLEVRLAAKGSGATVSWRSLTPSQLAQINRLILWSGQNINGIGGLAGESTYALAGLNFSAAQVKAVHEAKDSWLFKSDSLRMPLQSAGKGTIAWALAYGQGQPGKGIEHYEFFKGFQETLKVTFDFGSGIEVVRYFEQIEPEQNAVPTKYADLPASFRAEIEEEAKRPVGIGE